MSDPRAALRRLLAQERCGVLSTLHHAHGGWPFGSLAPYALTAAHEPVFLFSAIAEHTHNLRADPRASLLVHDRDAADDPLAGARLTLLGRAEAVAGDERERALTRYLARFPEAEGRAAAHDFAPYVLRVERVRWIAGFGSMGWFERTQWA